MRKIKRLAKVFAVLIFFTFLGLAAAAFTFIYLTPAQKEVRVPDVLGKDFSEAFDLLSAEGLSIKKIKKPSADLAPNYIISQNPPSGKLVKVGHKIELLVSIGENLIDVPDLGGYSFVEAKNALRRLQAESNSALKIGNISYVSCEKVAKDYILSQNPPPDSFILPEESISLLVSLGQRPTYFYMPEFIGQELEEAKEKIEKMGFLVEKIVKRISPNMRSGLIIDQSPISGSKVAKNERITLIVSKRY
ncbi:PASTA domain-containing protein [bacterium]|nr:PASTA domain-containing protein [bacterium]